MPMDSNHTQDELKDLHRRYKEVESGYIHNLQRANVLYNALDWAMGILESNERLLRDVEQQMADQSERLQNVIDQLKEVLHRKS